MGTITRRTPSDVDLVATLRGVLDDSAHDLAYDIVMRDLHTGRMADVYTDCPDPFDIPRRVMCDRIYVALIRRGINAEGGYRVLKDYASKRGPYVRVTRL